MDSRLTHPSPSSLFPPPLSQPQGQEKEYIVRAEQDKLKKLREQLAKQRKHLDDVETAINDLHGESGNKKQ
jgi:hypothetical protein